MNETKPLSIKDYLQNTVKENGSTEASPAGSSETSGTSTVYQWEESFKSDDGRHQIARFRYAPFTGEAFERKNYTYANYRVRLTVVLLDDKGNELDGTKATDISSTRMHVSVRKLCSSNSNSNCSNNSKQSNYSRIEVKWDALEQKERRSDT